MKTDGYTLEVIANRLGLTRERVRQLETHALRKLRHPKNNKAWREIFETISMIEQIKIKKWVIKAKGGE